MDEKVITEEEIAGYLLNTPEFFERHAQTLAAVQLTSPHGQRAVSLQERQMELLREKIKGLELRMAHMIRAGGENDQIQQKILEWSLVLLQEREARRIPDLIVQGLQGFFNVPELALRVWGLDSVFANSVYARLVSDDVHSFIKSMNGEPYCGHNPDLEVVSWLEHAPNVRSVALLPLYAPDVLQVPFGLLVLGSSDAQRFTADMGVDILKNIATIASSALMRCIKSQA